MRQRKFRLSAFLLLGFGLMGLQAQTPGTFTDSRDGKVYQTVKIGEQVWMAENLAYKPASGNYWAYDNEADNIAVYGYLYDWETARNVCPTGWHLPTDAEWTQLTDYLGGVEDAGGKLKATTQWNSQNAGATNESGFAALPGGYRSYSTFDSIGNNGYWWSATDESFFGPWSRIIYHDSIGVGRMDNSKELGLSVRCIRD